MKTKKFLEYIISNVKPKVGDIMVCIQKNNINYGLTSPVSKVAFGFIDTKNWKVVVSQYFTEVLTDFADENDSITLDCYLDKNPNSSSARCIGRITLDGELLRGDNPEIKDYDFNNPLVIEAIKEVKKIQKKLKESLVIDEVLKQIREDVEKKDLTAIFDLLMLCPSTILKSYLPKS